MSAYKLAPLGVIDTMTGEVILANFPGWSDYESWLNAGNVPDPMDAAAPSLAERRLRVVRRTQEFMRAAWYTHGVEFDGARFTFDAYEFTVLLGWAIAGGTAFMWRDAMGAPHSFNHARLLALVEAASKRQRALLTRSWQIEAAINGSTEPETIIADDYGGI